MKPLAAIVLLVASTTWASDPLLRVQPREHVIEFSNGYQVRSGFNTCAPGTVKLAMPVAAESMFCDQLTGEPADPDTLPPPPPPNTCNGFNPGLRSVDIPLLLDVVERVEFVTWAEFYLPDIGWIPFDPNLMRKWTGSREGRWPGFGSIEELNERVPIAYHITAPGEPDDLAMEREIQLGTHVPWAWGWEPSNTRRLLPEHQGVDIELD